MSEPIQIVVQSHGMGVESQAILERWEAEPESRPFKDWSQLIIITAQVGEEHEGDTIKLMEMRALPLMRKHKIRFVELARRGHLEEEGIVVLQDTREPYKLHPKGVYKLSDELLHSGTVPQFGGEHRCAMKFKAFVIETWLAWEFRDATARPVYHVFGYNADETTRIVKSDFHIARHNEDRLILKAGSPIPMEVFGFNSEEVTRIERSKKYDGPNRIGNYPLLEWMWNRAKCIGYILEKTGLLWVKSHCSFCPFCGEAAKGEPDAVARWRAEPVQTAHGMMVEYNSLCFNPRGHLYKNKSLGEVVRQHNVTEVLEVFVEKMENIDWAIYRVRRIYTKKGKAVRCVERLMKCNSQTEALTRLRVEAQEKGHTRTESRGIYYVNFASRDDASYPTREGFLVAAPMFMGKLKVRGPLERFNDRWERIGRGEPMNPEKAPPKTKKKVAAKLRKKKASLEDLAVDHHPYLNDRPSGN